MLSKQLFTVALLALAANADDHVISDPEVLAADYPEFAWAMSTLYPTYSWEAHKVTSGGNDFTKTLFHITSSSSNPNWRPSRQSVLIVCGGTTNAMTWFNTASAVYGDTKEEYAGAWESALLESIVDNAADLPETLYALNSTLPDRFDALASYWKDEGIVELDTVLGSLDEPEEGTCSQTRATDSVNEYAASVAALGTADNQDAMRQPSSALPINLFDYGFDVWIDGNRGSIYQAESDLDRSTEAYWQWDLRDMALEDQAAQIDYIVSTDRNVEKGYDFISYVGYSLGTRQMYYLMGMAAENDIAATTVSKVDKFLSLASCPWSSPQQGEPTTKEELAARLAQLRADPQHYFWGEGADIDANVATLCDQSWSSTLTDEEIAFAQEMCVGYIGQYGQYADSMSKQEMMSEYIGNFDQALYKTFPADWGVDGAYPTDAIDWTRAEGPDLYQFSGDLDIQCLTTEIADVLFAAIPTAQKQYNYECADHMFFPDSGVQNLQLHKDMIIVLGAQALAATAIAAVATVALF